MNKILTRKTLLFFIQCPQHKKVIFSDGFMTSGELGFYKASLVKLSSHSNIRAKLEYAAPGISFNRFLCLTVL